MWPLLRLEQLIVKSTSVIPLVVPPSAKENKQRKEKQEGREEEPEENDYNAEQ